METLLERSGDFVSRLFAALQYPSKGLSRVSALCIAGLRSPLILQVRLMGFRVFRGV